MSRVNGRYRVTILHDVEGSAWVIGYFHPRGSAILFRLLRPVNSLALLRMLANGVHSKGVRNECRLPPPALYAAGRLPDRTAGTSQIHGERVFICTDLIRFRIDFRQSEQF